ncbi:carbohydrate-binding domain-containing protein [Paenibacillus sp. CF384]|uniref:carbohydrate-binding domain-containing protein n=1 Tax=Paenibacillus sp. CF384 TaxID=1884382 RepID=UPI000894E0A5|nr:carbohydrate-binding domain-containing protein [Paenibacillus sp. CF384]SDX54543.1 protein of unknown function [Paenibacillus sp. CF384]
MKPTQTTKKLSALLLCAVLLTACSDNAALNESASTGTNATTADADAVSQAEAATLASLKLDGDIEYDTDDAYEEWSETDATLIKLNGASATIEGEGAEAKEGTITITKAGTYAVSGKLDDGRIVVHVADKGTVRLILNGAEIHNASSSAIYVEEAGKTILSLAEGTDNRVEDGAKYVFPDGSEEDAEPNAAIFSKDDLTINGSGKLVVEGHYNNGITSKDKLKITGGTLAIHAADDAVMGRDLVAVEAGNLTIEAGGHGIKTTKDTEGEEGVIAIEGGSFDITSGEDALHSSGGLLIGGGELHINAGDDGVHAELALAVTGGTVEVAKSNEGLEAPSILIAGGTTTVESSDDGVNAASGDSETADGGQGGRGPGGGGGTPPDMLDGGKAPAAAGEGGQAVDGASPGTGDGSSGGGGTPPEGAPSFETSPDGMPPDGAFGGMRPGGAAGNNTLTISGGQLTVNAAGDGLDANGSIFMSGGTVIVNGPTENGNGSLDYDGSFELTSGFLVAAGSSGMAQAISDQSTQAGILMTYPQTQEAGTLIRVEDGAGDDVLTFAPLKDYQAVFVSSPDLKVNTSYVLYSGGTSTGSQKSGLYDGGDYQGGTKLIDFKTSTIVTWLNESGVTEARSGMGGPGGGGGGFPGRRGGGDGGQGGRKMTEGAAGTENQES